MKQSFACVPAMLIALAAGCTHRQEEVAAYDKVFLTGHEQTVVDSHTRKSEEGEPKHFGNSLDHAFAVLLARAHPRPEPRKLVRNTVGSLCGEFQRQTSNRISAAQHETWAAAALEAGSFDAVLRDMEMRGGKHVDRPRLVGAGLRGMLRATCWRSACVLTGAQAAELERIVRTRKTHKEPGILGLKLHGWPAVEVVPGMPAAEAGLRSGDVVLSINGEKVSHIRTGSAAAKVLRGFAGETVRLTVRRAERTLAFEIRRCSVAASMLSEHLVGPGMAHIRIPTFEGSGVADRVQQMVRKHVSGGASVIILDVRDNAGGRPEEANGTADIFLDDKVLQTFQFRNGKCIAFKSKPGSLDVGLVVLTNKHTGSAAEMLILALHGHGRATTVGERTAGTLFGKDFEKLRNGQVIVFRSEPTIISPRGNDYSETGVHPDIAIADTRSSNEDKVLQRATRFARAQIRKGTARPGAP